MKKKKFTFKNRRLTYEKSVIQDCMSDLQTISQKMLNPEEYAKKDVHMEYVKYINQAIDFDNTNDIDLVSNDGSVKWFNFDDYKKELILYTDIISIGGRIAMASFDIKQFVGIGGGTSSAVSTTDMTSYILDELNSIKINIVKNKESANVQPFGVNCVLASMIEHELKLHSHNKYIKTVLTNAKPQIDSGTLVLAADDVEYFNDLYESLVNNVTIPNGGNDIIMTGKRFKKFLADYPSLSLNYGIENQMFDRTLTLNNLVQNVASTSDWEPEFLELMKRVFGTSNLNLRNCLAHCGYTQYNYHSPYTSFFLNEILMIIIKDFYLK